MTTPATPATDSAARAAPPADGTGLLAYDPWLAPYADRLRDRHAHYAWMRSEVERAGGLLGPVSQGHRYFGLNRGERDGRPGVWYREWAPAAYALFLVGDFNGWNRQSHPLARDEWGTWSTFLPDADYAGRLTHGSKVKVFVVSQTGGMDRLPAYIRRVVQDPHTHGFIGQYWSPPEPYRWQHANPHLDRGLRIYEAHVGMATEHEKVGSYDEFTNDVLPRVKRLGYNAIQLMAVMEHPYYGSFGYHVSNFFAVASRNGTPEELKRLIDTAHSMGILLLLDIVHSHAVKNTNEGLGRFDGTDYQYFHAGGRGEHSAWDSLLFDYGKFEVQRFLLSNLRYWLEEFRFDGFRFDGVTSMLYNDHGLGKAFGSYDDYFDGNVDKDAVGYLQLANELVHAIKPDAVTIAEDVSGMVGICRSVPEGGIGFDYRLSMGIPDFWIKLLKEKKDEDWSLGGIYHTLMNRRHGEKHVAYAESHDQALVGDKTIAFWLMDQEMYWNMSKFNQSLVVDRGVALHKLIRLLTFSLGGEAYLTFMGNEFGHPEWVDFPREGNGYSYKYARRQWSLPAQEHLKYAGLERFDAAMLALDDRYNLLNDPFIEQLDVREDMKLMVYRRGPVVVVVNLHPTESYTGLRIPIPDPVDYALVLDTDEGQFEGFGRVAAGTVYPKQDVPMYTRAYSTQVYIPARTAQVLVPAGR
jgi:1,4-alpha-glucan branching enzyme